MYLSVPGHTLTEYRVSDRLDIGAYKIYITCGAQNEAQGKGQGEEERKGTDQKIIHWRQLSQISEGSEL